MKIVRAEALGFCFGVRDALAAAEAAAPAADAEAITIYGELVHNRLVNERLASLGYRALAESAREAAQPGTPLVLITAHGISNRERSRLEAGGHQLIDTTCPLVRRAHEAAQQLAAEGDFVVVIGRRGHVEVRGLTGDLDRFDVAESAADVRDYGASRIGVLCQTTTTVALAEAVLAEIRARNAASKVRYVDTICRPTRDRQEALDRLLPAVDAVVVIGGRGSRNTRELAEAARARGARTLQVESAHDLDRSWFDGVETVGITAGTSTPDSTIDEVEQTIRRWRSDGAAMGRPWGGDEPAMSGEAF